METAVFWIAWGLISFWALKTFYYSFSKEKLDRLRKAALGINFAVFILTFLPWLPDSPAGGPPRLGGGESGLMLALEGNLLAVLFYFFLVSSIALFLAKDASLLKLASTATFANTLLLFIIMYQLRPGTFILTFYNIAPIVAVLLLLVANVAILLLWQQLQLKEKKKTDRKPVFLILVAGLTLFAIFFATSRSELTPQTTNSQKGTLTSHTNDKYKYAISYPDSWTSDTSGSQAPADLFFDKEKNVLIAVQVAEDPRLSKDNGFTLIMEDMKKEFARDTTYTLEAFKETTFHYIPGLYATGSFTDKDGTWNFVEYTLFPGKNTFYVLRGNVKQHAEQSQRAIRDTVIASFDITPLRLVAFLPEVVEFKNAVEENGRSTFRIELEKFGPAGELYIVVRVFEVFSDHQTTFNRYRVDPKGMVSRYNGVTDTWENIERM